MIEHSAYEVWSPVRDSDADLRYQEATGRTSSSTSLNDAVTYAMVGSVQVVIRSTLRAPRNQLARWRTICIELIQLSADSILVDSAIDGELRVDHIKVRRAH